MTRPETDDAELLREMLAGDERAFVALYRRRHADVYRFALAMCRSGAVAEDVVQDVFLRVLEDAAGFDPARGSVRAWLLGCARHVVLDRLRAERRWAPDAATKEDERSAPCGGEEAVFAEQRVARLREALLRLPVAYREAVVLCEIAELSYAESAAVLGCPIGTVRSRLHRARTLLAEMLAGTKHSAEPLRMNEVCS
ncbi:MAG TPA: RNA polymerase sigma factor [Gammaproteobacteria bacterium]|nr:RNA polymerase sigma factor [Gammaproteobacteria bacterium]